jgi:hypothetical protein
MSGVNGVTGGHQHHHVTEATQSAPTPAATGPRAASDTEANPLQALQNLMTQIEGSANTRAIPAHQNW